MKVRFLEKNRKNVTFSTVGEKWQRGGVRGSLSYGLTVSALLSNLAVEKIAVDGHCESKITIIVVCSRNMASLTKF